MKISVQICRVITALLFIFSGIIKLNDPSGFALKLNEYFDVFAEEAAAKQDTLSISIIESGKTLGQKSFVLYSRDKEKNLEISSEIETIEHAIEGDSIHTRKSFVVSIEADLENETVAEAEFNIPDSAGVVFVAAKASVAGKSIFQKDYKIGIADQLHSVSKLNIRDYVKQESWLNGFFKSCKQWTLWLSVFICALEVILGFALIVGWSMRLTSWLLLLLILFFTFLTFYAAYFNKVTDCGCFGDFIKLKPWHSFFKDVILLFLITIVFIGRKHIKPWFSKKFGWKFISIISLFAAGFGIYCYMFLPVWDFLPFKKGNNILKILTEVPTGKRASDSTSITYILHKGNDSMYVAVPPYTEYVKYTKDSWLVGRRIDKVIVEGYKWPIRDFSITNTESGIDLKDSFLNFTKYQLVLSIPYIKDAFAGSNKNIKEIAGWAAQGKIPFFALTSSATTEAEQYAKMHQWGFHFYSADWKLLMSMARYNPTLYLFKGPVVVKKWSGRNLPSVKRLEKLTSK